MAGRGGGLNENFTVRKISYGEGVERVFPVYSPMIEAVEMVRRGSVRRAKLYYLRDLRGKSARISENTGVRAKKLNDGERQAFLTEKNRLEAEKIASAQALAAEKTAADAAEAKAMAEAAKAAAEAEKAAKAAAAAAVPFVDNIVLIDGIGEKTAEALVAAGVATLGALAAMSDEALAELSEKIGAGEQWKSQEWKVQAQEMIGGKPPRAKVDQELARKLATG